MDDMIDIDLTTYSEADLQGLISRAHQELAARRPAARPVAYSLTLYAGNERAGAKAWVKLITGLDPTRGNAYGIVGRFVDRAGAAPDAAYLLIGGKGGSHKRKTTYYVLTRVCADSTFESSSGYQRYSGTGLELICDSDTECEPQSLLEAHPELAPCVGKRLAPIFAALRAAGY